MNPFATPADPPAASPWPAITTAFQPIVDFRTGRVHAYEALVRGLDGGDAAGVMARVPLDRRHAFDQHCRDVAVADAARLALGRPLSLNLHYVDAASCIEAVRATLGHASDVGLASEHLMFEVMECARIADPAALGAALSGRSGAWRLLLDDFGRGPSGLEILEKLRPDGVKLDRLLVHGAAENAASRAIVRKVVEIARAHDFIVYAKGVEQRVDFEALARLGVRYFQGYLFAAPEIANLAGSFPVLAELREKSRGQTP